MGIVEGWWVLFLLPFSSFFPFGVTLLYTQCIPVCLPWVLFLMNIFLALLIKKKKKKDTFKIINVRLLPLMTVYMSITYTTKTFRT